MCAAQDSFHVVCAQLPQRFDMSRPTGRPAERLADGTQLLNAGQVLVLQMELTYRSQTRSDAATLPTALACDDVIPAFALYPDYADVDTAADIDVPQSYLENNYGDNNKSACQPNISLLKGLVIMFRSVLVVPWLGPSLFGSFCSRGSVARSLAVRFSTFRTFSNLSYLLQPFIPPPTFHTLVAPSGEGRRSASSGCFTVSERPALPSCMPNPRRGSFMDQQQTTTWQIKTRETHWPKHKLIPGGAP